MIKTALFHKILSGITIGFSLWFLGPIIIELAAEPPEGDEVGLFAMLIALLVTSVFSIGLWVQEDRLNNSLLLKWFTIIFIILMAIVVLLFTYSSWLLLVVSLTIFYAWIKRIVQSKITTRQNITWMTILCLSMSIFVFSQLVP